MNCKVSVAIPTKNRADDLRECLQSILLQSYPVDEIVVVDQSDSHETKMLFRDMLRDKSIKSVYDYDTRISGLCEARNRARVLVSGDIIFYFDDDVVLDVDYIKNTLSVYQGNPNVLGVGGVITNNKFLGKRKIRLFKKIFMFGIFRDLRSEIFSNYEYYSHPVRTKIMSGGVCSYKAAVIRRFSFDQKMDRIMGRVSFGEDVEYSLRVAKEGELLINPFSRLVHNHKTHLKKEKQRASLFYFEVLSWSYILKKNFTFDLIQWICFFWLFIGWSIRALHSLVMLDSSLLVSLVLGLRKGFSSFKPEGEVSN